MEFEVTKLGERGQVVIPQEFRKSMGLKTGDKLFVMERANTLIQKGTNSIALGIFIS